jgi:MSHA pilin protein MshC
MKTPITVKGFTLVELVMVMVLVGILAIAVMPRFADKSTFETRGFFDQSIDMLRYAQKVAIAQRTNVFVSVDAASGRICLTYVVNNPTCTLTVPPLAPTVTVANPADQQWFRITAPTGVVLAVSTTFSFLPLGRPSAAQAITMSGNGATQTITVEAETGYVH